MDFVFFLFPCLAAEIKKNYKNPSLPAEGKSCLVFIWFTMYYKCIPMRLILDAGGIRIICLWNGNFTGIQFEFYADGFKAVVEKVQEGSRRPAGHFRKKAGG